LVGDCRTPAMIETIDPKTIEKPLARCADCDHEVEHYNTFLSSTNDPRIVCWECLAREEKGFNASPGFFRRSRRGVIPR